MREDKLKKDFLIFFLSAVLAFVIFYLRFLETINIVVVFFFAIFVGSLVILIKNAVMHFKYQEHQRGNIGKSVLIFSGIALISLILTCILAAILGLN